jgi:stringent starvation protein B
MKNLALSLAIIIPLLFAPAVYARGESGNSYAMAKLAKEKQEPKPQEDADQKAKAPGNAMETPGPKGRQEQADKESRNLRIKKVERLRGKKVKSWQVLNH